jgi:2'-5' RNA ligase
LLYDTKLVQPQPIEPITVAVNELALVHSKRWLTEYVVKERWPLCP